MILSDRTIREEIAAERIVIEPFDPACVQPSSVDLHLDALFRVFKNHTLGHIDVKQQVDDLTELLEIPDGEAFMLHPGEFVLGSTSERIALPNDLVARLEGKALAIDTPIPTPDGWRLMGELRVGDAVFDEQGAPTLVVAATDVMVDRPCYEVVFSDGTTIVADGSHQWVTCDKNGRRGGERHTETRTTEQIAATLLVRGERNHQVQLAGPVHYPERELPVDPYVLGVWLGDGTTTAAHVTTADDEVLARLHLAGHTITPVGRTSYTYRVGTGAGHEARRVPSTGRYGADDSLQATLRSMQLLGDKQIPRVYLEASITQRERLLAGLMDSDGYVDESGRCEFVSTLEHLADGVVELAASLGFRPVKSKGRGVLNGVDHGPKYLVKFTPHRPVFKLRRKRDRQKPTGSRFHLFRAISDVRRVPSVPVRCIQVAASSGMFLAGPTFVPTHNSSLGRLGLLIHSTAGFVDAGWDGQLTLELSNVCNLPITLYPGMKIGQISFIRMTSDADVPYGSSAVGSKYQGQRGPIPSQYWKNFL